MLKILTDVNTNNSDKNFLVPALKRQTLLWVQAVYTTNATAGNRNLTLDINDGNPANVIFRINAGAVQAASLTNRYSIFNGAPRGAAFVANMIEIPVPMIALLPGWRIRIFDLAAIAPAGAGENLLLTLAVNERDSAGVDSIGDDMGFR